MKAFSAFLIVAVPATSLVADQPIVRPFESEARVTANNRIDEVVYARLRQLRIQPANSCSDEVFIRRVYRRIAAATGRPGRQVLDHPQHDTRGYDLHLGDTQGQGGAAYAYRLRISPPQPDFELRLTPASINVRAGETVPVDVYALRRDGFSGDILLSLSNVPRGFSLSGGKIPAGRDHVRLTLTAPAFAREQPIRFGLEGLAEIAGRGVRRTAVPAENMMQAFAYQHLVPAELGLVSVVGRSRVRAPLQLVGDLPVKLPVGGTARVQFAIGSNPLLDQIQLELNDPPQGVSIQDKSTVDDGIVMLLNAADNAQSGLKGNLIVDAFIERAIPGTGNRRRFPIGTLPAVPFEIVQP